MSRNVRLLTFLLCAHFFCSVVFHCQYIYKTIDILDELDMLFAPSQVCTFRNFQNAAIAAYSATQDNAGNVCLDKEERTMISVVFLFLLLL